MLASIPYVHYSHSELQRSFEGLVRIVGIRLGRDTQSSLLTICDRQMARIAYVVSQSSRLHVHRLNMAGRGALPEQ